MSYIARNKFLELHKDPHLHLGASAQPRSALPGQQSAAACIRYFLQCQLHTTSGLRITGLAYNIAPCTSVVAKCSAYTPLAPSLCTQSGCCAKRRASFSVLPLSAATQALFAKATSSRLCEAGCGAAQQGQSLAEQGGGGLRTVVCGISWIPPLSWRSTASTASCGRACTCNNKKYLQCWRTPSSGFPPGRLLLRKNVTSSGNATLAAKPGGGAY